MAPRTRRDYQPLKPELMPFVLDSFARLNGEADLVLVEGAGSASEINLRAQRHRQYGLRPRRRRAGGPDRRHRPRRRHRQPRRHQAVLDPDDAALIHGFLVNKFRGDPALFATAWR